MKPKRENSESSNGVSSLNQKLVSVFHRTVVSRVSSFSSMERFSSFPVVARPFLGQVAEAHVVAFAEVRAQQTHLLLSIRGKLELLDHETAHATVFARLVEEDVD
mmetsp:Transcript_4433/g.9937  ORF Transcript_4433/g.9937 Transcript_4433/m.9937 type:complete len:105 (+) Transcript_4433:1-315(+)